MSTAYLRWYPWPPPHAAPAPVSRAPIGLMVLAAVAVVVPAGLLTGVMAAPVAGLADPGAIVRWGLPVVRGPSTTSRRR